MNTPLEESGKGAVRMRRPERKRQILHHAKQLFVSLGYQQTTTEKIARASGVTEPVLYRHFSSKKALFLDVLDEIRETTLHGWREEARNLPHAMARLRAVADLYMNSTRANAAELRVMHVTLLEAADAEIAERLRAFYSDTEAFLAELIAEGQIEGVLRPDIDPRVAAWELIRNSMGFALTAALDLPHCQTPQFLAQSLDCILRGLKSPQVAEMQGAVGPFEMDPALQH